MIFLAYSLYIASFVIAFLVSYYYIHYTREHSTIHLHANVITASVMQLSIHSLFIFVWFLYTFPTKLTHSYIGLQLGVWLILISQLILISFVLYKFKKEETITFAKQIWNTSKEKLAKTSQSIRTLSKIQIKKSRN
ncbi:hypothetical protein [Paraliobacillus salinarum]|uniref:hypothetical protein n=1 Tax=Paraliobacillus salinarum TaxID=1158996 RepID=UPI0015F4EC71|nr:hypothetical protein [Paraliobacillus salinarum]